MLCDGDWVEGLDGIDSEGVCLFVTWWFFFFLLPISKCSVLTTGYVFGLSLPLFLLRPSFTSHWEPEELELISADVPSAIGRGRNNCLSVLGGSQSVGHHPKTKFKHMLFTECFHTQ